MRPAAERAFRRRGEGALAGQVEGVGVGAEVVVVGDVLAEDDDYTCLITCALVVGVTGNDGAGHTVGAGWLLVVLQPLRPR